MHGEAIQEGAARLGHVRRGVRGDGDAVHGGGMSLDKEAIVVGGDIFVVGARAER
jgi:hypothetical protein